jgi:hypothetical protein
MATEQSHRDPCPVQHAWLTLERSHPLPLAAFHGPDAEAEANSFLLQWSQHLLSNDPGVLVWVEITFANGYHCQNRHHVVPQDPDGTIRGHALDALAMRKQQAFELEDGRVLSSQVISQELQGWPPQEVVAKDLKTWARNRQACADLHDESSMGHAEYCAALLALLDQDYPILDAVAAARQALQAWAPQLPAWWAGVDEAHRRAHLLVINSHRNGSDST